VRRVKEGRGKGAATSSSLTVASYASSSQQQSSRAETTATELRSSFSRRSLPVFSRCVVLTSLRGVRNVAYGLSLPLPLLLSLADSFFVILHLNLTASDFNAALQGSPRASPSPLLVRSRRSFTRRSFTLPAVNLSSLSFFSLSYSFSPPQHPLQ